MVDLDKLIKDTFKELETFDVGTILPDLKYCAEGSINDVLNTQDSLYYQWITCLMRTYKPRQVVELGGAMGCSALCMLSQLPEDAKLYSATLEERGLEFSYIKTEYPQLTKIIGDDANLDIWPEGLVWKNTDLLFIDAEHSASAVKRELETYLPLIGKGKLVLMDDIHMEELFPVWLNLNKEKRDLSVLHHSGFCAFIS